MFYWENLLKETYSDILYNVSEVIFNLYYSNYPRTIYEDIRYFMIYKMINVVDSVGFDTRKNLRNYLMMIARNGGSMYLYHENKVSDMVELTNLNAPSVDFDFVEEVSSKSLYDITSKFIEFGDYTKPIMNILIDCGVSFDSWYDDNIHNEVVKDVNNDLLSMIRSMFIWKLAKEGDVNE